MALQSFLLFQLYKKKRKKIKLALTHVVYLPSKSIYMDKKLLSTTCLRKR